MKKFPGIAGLAAIALLSGCGTPARMGTGQSPATVPKPQAPLIQAAAPPSPPLLPVPVAPITKTVPVKGLMASTNPQTQSTQVVTTPKRDPFAPVLSLPENLKAIIIPSVRSSTAKRTSQPKVTAKALTKTLPSASVVKLPPSHRSPLVQESSPQPLLDLPSTPPLANLPSLAESAARPVAPTSLAAAIEVTGVVQTTDQLVAIVKSPGDTSRYVKTGEYLAGGQVWLKQIVISKGGEPRVILQQNGVEVIKSIGETSSIARGL